jgi:hypothetical protein
MTVEWLETKTLTLTWLDANAGVAMAPQATATRRSLFIAFLICDLVPAGRAAVSCEGQRAEGI